jgi:NADH dehydrogenase
MTISQATVFGGSGFLGRYVVKRLAEAGYRVLVGVRRPEKAGFLRTMGDVGQVVPIKADITDSDVVADAIAGSDTVINLVGILYERGAQRFAAIHAQGAERVAKAAWAAGVERLVHVSAIGADPQSSAAYGRSKAAGEAAVTAAFPGATIVRPSLVIGAEDGFFNLFGSFARVTPVLPLIKGGKTRFQPIHVGDVASAIMRMVEDPATKGKVIELGGPRVYSFRELLEIILDETGRHSILVPVPDMVINFEAWFLEFFPEPPLTRDQVAMLGHDSVVGESGDSDVGRIEDLGIEPIPIEAVAPEILRRYRPAGGERPSRYG